MTKEQAKKLAQQIFDEFGNQIREATRGTNIPPEFIAGLVANEAGKDRQGNIRRAATRFEPHIYTKLKQVANNPRLKFQSIRHNDLKDATDESLRALAHSYEATQMMGYWCIVLGCTLADLKNPDKHFFYTVKLLQLNDQNDFSNPDEGIFDDEMRQWNTGREKGKTYHENYVPNARLIRAAYKELEKNHAKRPVNERVNVEDSTAAHPSSNQTVITESSAMAGTQSTPAVEPAASSEPPPNITEVKTTEAVQVEERTLVTEQTATAPKGEPADAPPTKVTKAGPLAKWLFSSGGALTIFTGIWGFITTNGNVIGIAILVLGLLICALIFRGAITDAIRMTAAADPDKNNVT